MQELKSRELQTHLKRKLLVDANDKDKLRTILKKEGYSPEQTANGYFELFDNEAIISPDRIATLLVNEHAPPTLLKFQEEDLETYFLRTISLKEVQP